MSPRFILLLVSTVLAAIAIVVALWVAGPLLAIGDTHPLETVLNRALASAFVVVVVGVALTVVLIKRRRAEGALAQAVSGAATEPAGDEAALSARMEDALKTLKKSGGGKGDVLYDLPWYLIIGPPGAGKTTALVNSGLKFPLARGLSPAAVAGAGGTRYCDWWFTEDAVLIDTAGRYTTQDSDPKSDGKSWLAFLNLLRDNRPRQPINGVMVCFGLDDLMTADDATLVAHADAVRARLIELHETLKVDFPVYAIFTKADLVAGFTEFFGHLNEQGRKAVWGATFQTDDKAANLVGEVGVEFDQLIERLNLELLDRLQEEPALTTKVQVLSFPSQMAANKPRIVEFLNRIFEPTRYHANATLRGFYFTSGTQQGTPIDRLIGALARSFGTRDMAVAAYSGIGRSYFLSDLIKKVLVGEAGWVSTNLQASRRVALARGAALAGLIVLTLGMLGAWWHSYQRNSGLIVSTLEEASRYKQIGEALSTETIVSDGDVSRPLRHLHHLRQLPAGFAERDNPTPLGETFGLSQRPRLNSATESAYKNALERHFRSRLLFRIESELRRRPDDTNYAFQAFPVYLMLGGREPVDASVVRAFFLADWEQNQFRGAANADGRRALLEHLDALLAFEPPIDDKAIVLDEALIRDTQRMLARLGPVERGFEILRASASGQRQRDWTVARRGGPDVDRVFEGRNGESLEDIRVPYLFTYAGFHEAFLAQLPRVRVALERDRRLFGEAADQTALQVQFAELETRLMTRYTQEFTQAWSRALNRLVIKPLTADRPRYVALDAAARATSPLVALLESIRDETQLTRERPRQAGQAGGAPAATATPLPFPEGFVPGADVEAAFRPLHVVVEAQGGRRVIDDVIKNLSDIQQSLMAMADPNQAVPAQQAFRQHLQSLNGNAARLPPPFSNLLRTAANALDQDATGSAVARLNRALSEQVTEVCRAATAGRYPFVPNASAEISIPDFERLFGIGGIIDRFFTVNLASMADTTRREWAWNPTHPVARQLPPGLIRDFQRAAAIRDTFMRSGGAGFNFVVRNTSTAVGLTSARLEVSGAVLETVPPAPPAQASPLQALFGAAPPPAQQQRPASPTPMQWPGPSGLWRAAVVVQDASGRTSTLERSGPWAFFRLLEQGQVQPAGDTVSARFTVGGRDVAYAINVVAGTNPLTSPLLRDFRCPGAQ